LRKDEFIKLLKSQKLPKIEILEDRWKGSIFLPTKKSDELWNCLTGKDFIYWKKELLGETGEIKGAVAYPGKVQGLVKKHLSTHKTSKISSGSVVVSGMTNPQMVPYLKNAIAIVTDEGGITCHAAIISRELKIPCIVGTKIATQVLNDGDLVEVDANKGIVKIIKKAK
jgi:phosphoenolpyruvate synthase/pyruvate phosphate dikinase